MLHTFTRDGIVIKHDLEELCSFESSEKSSAVLGETFVRYGIAPCEVSTTIEFLEKARRLFTEEENRQKEEEDSNIYQMVQRALWLSENLVEQISCTRPDAEKKAGKMSSSLPEELCISTTTAPSSNNKSPPLLRSLIQPGGQKCFSIDQDFVHALDLCRELCNRGTVDSGDIITSSCSSITYDDDSAAVHAANTRDEEEEDMFVSSAIAALKRLRSDEGSAALETENITSYITCNSLEKTTARRRYACETNDLAIAPMSMTDVKRHGERLEEEASRKRKRVVYKEDTEECRTTYEMKEEVEESGAESSSSSLPSTNQGVFEVVNVHEYVWTQTVRHLLDAIAQNVCSAKDVLFKSVDALPHGPFLNRATWPMSRREVPFMTLAIRNSWETEIEGAYNMLEDNESSMCVDATADFTGENHDDKMLRKKLKSEGMLYLENRGPGFEARQVLLMELLDVFRSCMFPLRLAEDATFAEIIDTALQYNHIGFSETNGVAFNAPGVSTVLRGNILSMCYLPAKSVLVDGSPRILSIYENIVYDLAGLRAEQLAMNGADVRNFDSIICEPVNYMVIRKDVVVHNSTAAKPVGGRKIIIEEPPVPSQTCDFGRSGVKEPYDHIMYDVYDNFYDEVFDLRERYSGVFVVQDAGDEEVATLTVTCIKGISDLAVWTKMREFFISKLRKKKNEASNFYKSRPVKVAHRDLAEFVRSLGFSSVGKNICVERTTLRSGDVFVWNNKTPCFFSLRGGGGSSSSLGCSQTQKSVALLAELDYFPRSQCLESEDKKRLVRMLSNNVRSSRHTQVTNSYEWNAAHRLVYVWKKRDDIVHGYLMWDPVTKTPLYYQNCPWRRLDEVRGIRHYAGVTQTAVSIDLLS